MMRKIGIVLVSLLCLFCVTNIYAASESNFIDMQSYENIYKLSEDSDVTLPFIKVFNEKASFDKKIDKSGLTIAASVVEIADDVNGLQTIIAGDTVDIKGSMEYAVILAANVDISGTIEKDVFIIADSVFITETANILGDVVVMANTLELKGIVQGNFIGSSTEFLMEGNVGKDFRVCSPNITFNETDIKGNIYIETDTNLNISEKYQNAVVEKYSNVVTKSEKKNLIINAIIDVILVALLFTVLNLSVIKRTPELFKNMANKSIAHLSYTVIMGVALIVTIPVVALLAVICSFVGVGVVTTPLFVVYIALVVVAISLSKFIVGSVLYEIIRRKIIIVGKFKETCLLLGIFMILNILSCIPYVAWYVIMVMVLLSSGILVTGMTKKE